MSCLLMIHLVLQDSFELVMLYVEMLRDLVAGLLGFEDASLILLFQEAFLGLCFLHSTSMLPLH